jgi:hypothetical protein
MERYWTAKCLALEYADHINYGGGDAFWVVVMLAVEITLNTCRASKRNIP